MVNKYFSGRLRPNTKKKMFLRNDGRFPYLEEYDAPSSKRRYNHKTKTAIQAKDQVFSQSMSGCSVHMFAPFFKPNSFTICFCQNIVFQQYFVPWLKTKSFDIEVSKEITKQPEKYLNWIFCCYIYKINLYKIVQHV